MQKQEIKKKLKFQKEENDKKEQMDKLNLDKQNEIENFKKFEDGIVEIRDDIEIDNNVNIFYLFYESDKFTK